VLLREEGSGILLWALAGFVKLQTEFAETGDFSLTDSQRERVDSLLAESDNRPGRIRKPFGRKLTPCRPGRGSKRHTSWPTLPAQP
jgi:hypothetical protein